MLHCGNSAAAAGQPPQVPFPGFAAVAAVAPVNPEHPRNTGGDMADRRATACVVLAAGKGTLYMPGFHASTPDTVWDHYGLTAERAAALPSAHEHASRCLGNWPRRFFNHRADCPARRGRSLRPVACRRWMARGERRGRPGAKTACFAATRLHALAASPGIVLRRRRTST